MALYEKYWTQVIKDLIDCSIDEYVEMSDDDYYYIANKLVDNNEFWNFIDETIYDLLEHYKVKKGE